MEIVQEIAAGVVMLLIAIAILGMCGWLIWKYETRSSTGRRLKRHFGSTPLSDVVVTERNFPGQIRVDLQHAIDEYLETTEVKFFTGIQPQYGLGGANFASLFSERMRSGEESASEGPPQYEQIDIGEDEPVRVLQSGLWLVIKDGLSMAMLYSPVSEISACGVSQSYSIQVATPPDADSVRGAEQFLAHLEDAVQNARSYRGKVLSLEQAEDYSGQAAGVQVHRLEGVTADQVILPPKTLELLQRNVIEFVSHRDRLADFGMTIKKGLLFYGPPGTGKTHTVRYLAGALSGHTTLLISAEQVQLLSQYMTLARLLQPCVVVIEDVDLIARERNHLFGGSEMLLNKLLNEMDGLREEASIIFILTTNRPEELEAALASRPGRIDQAIEFPLPDRDGRRKLVALYAHGLQLSEELTEQIVNRTEHVTASFIKELMRRTAQSHLANNGTASKAPTDADVSSSLEEMLFTGGSLNLKLLGGEGRIKGLDA